MTPLVVVLGASGRLGRSLLPAFAAAGFDTIAVTRAAPTCLPGFARGIVADLADADTRARLADTVANLTEGYDRIWIVDAVLDRRDIEAMRRSISAVTDAGLRLLDRIASRAATARLLVASTTAVLAPRLYQTPYGLAKRSQVITYARSGLAGAALLLPTLSAASGPGSVGAAPWPVWSFDRAAECMVSAALGTPGRGTFTIQVPDLTQVPAARRAYVLGTVSEVLRAHVRSMLTDRDSLHARREAARGRLSLSPPRMRRRVDHHFAPVELTRRFADRHDVHVIRKPPAHRHI